MAEVATKRPIVIAWAAASHAHFVPLIPQVREEQLDAVRWRVPHIWYSKDNLEEHESNMIAPFFDRNYVECDDYSVDYQAAAAEAAATAAAAEAAEAPAEAAAAGAEAAEAVAEAADVAAFKKKLDSLDF